MKTTALIFIGFFLLSFLFVALPTYEDSDYEDSEVEIPEEIQYRQGKIPTFGKTIYLISIDSGKTWLVVTPTREVQGYLHQLLPEYSPQDFRKVREFENGHRMNTKFYYFGL